MCSTADIRSIEKTHERSSLRLVLNDFTNDYSVLMEKPSKSRVYLDRLRQLCVETYNTANILTPISVSHISPPKIHIQLRDTNTLSLYKFNTKFNTIKYGKLSLGYETVNI